MEIISKQVQIGFILISLAYLSVVIGLVRNRFLKLNYALVWIFSAVVSLLLSVFPITLKLVTDFVGLQTPSNLLFAVSIILLVLIVLTLSVNVSKLSEQNRRLLQQLTILQSDISKKRK